MYLIFNLNLLYLILYIYLFYIIFTKLTILEVLHLQPFETMVLKRKKRPPYRCNISIACLLCYAQTSQARDSSLRYSITVVPLRIPHCVNI